jgi:hypothetical protein
VRGAFPQLPRGLVAPAAVKLQLLEPRLAPAAVKLQLLEPRLVGVQGGQVELEHLGFVGELDHLLQPPKTGIPPHDLDGLQVLLPCAGDSLLRHVLPRLSQTNL